MIDFNLGGVNPRPAFMRAMLVLMGAPRGSGTGTDAFVTATLDNPGEQTLVEAARSAILMRQDALFALFPSRASDRCASLGLLFRTLKGAETLPVEPFQKRKGDRMVLVTTDRTRAFVLDARCILTEVPPPRGNVTFGIERAWTTIRETMADVLANPVAWSIGYFIAADVTEPGAD